MTSHEFTAEQQVQIADNELQRLVESFVAGDDFWQEQIEREAESFAAGDDGQLPLLLTRAVAHLAQFQMYPLRYIEAQPEPQQPVPTEFREARSYLRRLGDDGYSWHSPVVQAAARIYENLAAEHQLTHPYSNLGTAKQQWRNGRRNNGKVLPEAL